MRPKSKRKRWDMAPAVIGAVFDPMALRNVEQLLTICARPNWMRLMAVRSALVLIPASLPRCKITAECPSHAFFNEVKTAPSAAKTASGVLESDEDPPAAGNKLAELVQRLGGGRFSEALRRKAAVVSVLRLLIVELLCFHLVRVAWSKRMCLAAKQRDDQEANAHAVF
eukprot:CAMPEP_0178406360 /NCGR_PEP_ID=MMETSP0689_2-20121128/18872_1 /TAXON_ID=160604 /ORGANISM="Amphidinium massartii, Strain CS-259" /LENGTH=168 /DNA_ID=CAMNT_0020027399 /DNA_START=531 /DNA_END=1036 /DNA_ORIENTATION=-